MKFPKKLSPLEQAIDGISIRMAADALGLELPLTEDGGCLSPFRPENRESFSVYENGTRWHDFATEEDGDVVNFVAKTLAIQADAPDEAKTYLSEASRLLIKWHREGLGANTKTRLVQDRQKRKSFDSKRFRPFTSRPPRPGEVERLVEMRSLINDGGIQELIRRAMLQFTEFRLVPCWVLLDGSGHNAQLRSLYPDRLALKSKALTLSGSAAKWPIGLPAIAHCSKVLITEGPADLLAVTTAALTEYGGDLRDVALVAKTELGGIPETLLERFKGKQIRYFAHHDEAGLRAATRLEKQLKPIAGHFDLWMSPIPKEDFNDYASRIWSSGQQVVATKMA